MSGVYKVELTASQIFTLERAINHLADDRNLANALGLDGNDLQILLRAKDRIKAGFRFDNFRWTSKGNP